MVEKIRTTLVAANSIEQHVVSEKGAWWKIEVGSLVGRGTAGGTKMFWNNGMGVSPDNHYFLYHKPFLSREFFSSLLHQLLHVYSIAPS